MLSGPLKDLGKQWRPRSAATERGIRLGSTLHVIQESQMIWAPNLGLSLHMAILNHKSRDMTKPAKWVHPAKTQISMGIRPVWSESSLCTQWVAKGPWFLHADSEDWSDWADAQDDRSLRWVHTHFVGFVMSLLNLLRLLSGVSMVKEYTSIQKSALEYVMWRENRSLCVLQLWNIVSFKRCLLIQIRTGLKVL